MCDNDHHYSGAYEKLTIYCCLHDFCCTASLSLHLFGMPAFRAKVNIQLAAIAINKTAQCWLMQGRIDRKPCLKANTHLWQALS